MFQSLPESAARLAPWLLTYLLHSSLLILGALAFARFLKSHAARELVWKGALFGGLLTATVAGFVDPGASFGVLEVPATRAAVIGVSVGEFKPSGGTTMASIEPRTEATTGPQAIPIARTSPVSSAWASWPAQLSLAWLAIAALLIGHLVWMRTLLARALRHRRPVLDAAPLAALAELCDRTRPGWRPRLSMSRHLRSPVALGASEICVPERALVELGDEEQQAMLAHELAHIARRDPAWLFAAHGIERALFVQPFNRFVRRRMQREAEVLSDAWAVERTGKPFVFARCMMEVARWTVGRSERAFGIAMAREQSFLVERVERVLAEPPQQTRRAKLVSAFAIGGALAFLACAGPDVETESGESKGTFTARIIGVGEEREATGDVITVTIRVLREGSKLERESGQPWTGTGPYRFGEDRELHYSIGTQRLERSRDVQEALTKAYREGENTEVWINARQGTAYRDIVDVVDSAVHAGFTNISFIGAYNGADEWTDDAKQDGLIRRMQETHDEQNALIADTKREQLEAKIEKYLVAQRKVSPSSISALPLLCDYHAGKPKGAERGLIEMDLIDSPRSTVVIEIACNGQAMVNGDYWTPQGETLEDPRINGISVTNPVDFMKYVLPQLSSRMERKGRELSFGSMALPDDWLRLRLDEEVPFEWVLETMAICGQLDVLIPNIELASQARPLIFKTPLPVDLDVIPVEVEEIETSSGEFVEIAGTERPRRLEVTLVVLPEGGCGLVGEFGEERVLTQDSDELARFLRERKTESPTVTIDANGGMRFRDVIPVLQAIEAAGIENTVFVGKYPR